MNKDSSFVDTTNRPLNCICLRWQKNPGGEDWFLASKAYGIDFAESIRGKVFVVSKTLTDAERSLDVSSKVGGKTMTNLNHWEGEKFHENRFYLIDGEVVSLFNLNHKQRPMRN